MAKKSKIETINDIIDRIEDDLITLREKIDELENYESDSDDSDDFEEEDEVEDEDEDSDKE